MKPRVCLIAAAAWLAAQNPASARVIVITPAQAAESTITYQSAAPTRHFEVEKATTLSQGQGRVGANLHIGSLDPDGDGWAALSGGVNLRADYGVFSNVEMGLSVTSLGTSGISSLLGDLTVRGKANWARVPMNTTAVDVATVVNVGGLVLGGGLPSASLGFALPLTAALRSNLNLTLAPGASFGLSTGSLSPTAAARKTPPTGSTLVPVLGFGLDAGLTERLSAVLDAVAGASGDYAVTGNLGLRYGFSDSLAFDAFISYKGNPLTGGLATGNVGLGVYYGF